MLPLETLDALDLTLWLGSEVVAAQRLSCSQSTVSRRLTMALKVFGAKLVRRDGQLELAESCPLLTMQREVHQLARLLGHGQLRLELDHGVARDLLGEMPSHWCVGCAGGMGRGRRLNFLRERLVDGWLASKTAELPGNDDTTFQVFVLAQPPFEGATNPTSDLNGCLAVVVRSDVAASPAIVQLLSVLSNALKVQGPSHGQLTRVDCVMP